MDLISGMFRGIIMLSLIVLLQEGCSVKEMAGRAADAHKKGLSSYGEYSRQLTGSQRPWAKK